MRRGSSMNAAAAAGGGGSSMLSSPSGARVVDPKRRGPVVADYEVTPLDEGDEGTTMDDDIEGGGIGGSDNKNGARMMIHRQGSTGSGGGAATRDRLDLDTKFSAVASSSSSSPMKSSSSFSVSSKRRKTPHGVVAQLSALMTDLLYANNNNNHHHQHQHQNRNFGMLLLLLLVLFLLSLLYISYTSRTGGILSCVAAACVFGVVVSVWLCRAVLSCDDGTAEMRAVSDPIRHGAAGFLHVQYSTIASLAVPLALCIVVSYQFRPQLTIDDVNNINSSNNINSEPQQLQLNQNQQQPFQLHAGHVAVLGNTVLGLIAASGFLLGAASSALAGYVSMWVAAQSNIRVASAACNVVIAWLLFYWLLPSQYLSIMFFNLSANVFMCTDSGIFKIRTTRSLGVFFDNQSMPSLFVRDFIRIYLFYGARNYISDVVILGKVVHFSVVSVVAQKLR